MPDATGTRTFVYHTLFGNPRILNEQAIRFFHLMRDSFTLNTLREAVDADPHAIVEDLLQAGFLVPEGTDERSILRERRDQLLRGIAAGQTVDHISLSVSDDCNFGCPHCMLYQPDQTGKRLPIYQKTTRLLNMSWATAQACVDAYMALLRHRGETHARIHFGNGEPLINWPVIAQVLDYCERYTDFTFEFAINTNLSLLTPEMARKLKQHRVKIATSLDGIGEANDAIRVTRAGKATYNMILEKMDLLESIDYPLDGVSVTVTNRNFDLVDCEIVDFASARRMTSLAFDYDLVGFSSVPLKRRVEKTLRLKNYANSKGLYFGGTWLSPFRKLMTTSMLDRPHAFCAAMEGRALVFGPGGEVKTCGYTTTVVGQLHDWDNLFGSDGGLVRLAWERFPGAEPGCRGCVIEGPCGGQCHSTWEAARRVSPKLFAEMCEFYRAITDALIQDYLGAMDDCAALELRERYL